MGHYQEGVNKDRPKPAPYCIIRDRALSVYIPESIEYPRKPLVAQATPTYATRAMKILLMRMPILSYPNGGTIEYPKKPLVT
jgi:hypothetical protein